MATMEEECGEAIKTEKRKQKIKIAFMICLSVLDGMVGLTYGPAVPEYQCIFNKSRQTVSLLFPVYGTCGGIGTLLYYFIYRRLDTYVVGVICAAITCLLLVVLPLVPVFWLAVTVSAVMGLAAGVGIHARLVECGLLAKATGKSVPLHALPVGLVVGSLISPLIISLFLGEKHHFGSKSIIVRSGDIPFNTTYLQRGPTSNITAQSSDIPFNTTYLQREPTSNITAQSDDVLFNATYLQHEPASNLSNPSENILFNTTYLLHGPAAFEDDMLSNCTNCFDNSILNVTECRRSGIVFAFVIISGLGTLTILGYVLFRKTLRADVGMIDQTDCEESVKLDKLQIVFITLMFILFIVSGGTNFIYGSMLTTFGIHSSLDASPKKMALMTSSFFVTSLFGRVFSSCASLYVSDVIILINSLIGVLISALSLIFIAEKSIIYLWVGTTALAFTFAPLFGAILAWSNSASGAQKIIYGLIIVADNVGIASMSFLFRQLMNSDVRMMNYCMFAVSIVQGLIVVNMCAVAWIRTKKTGYSQLT